MKNNITTNLLGSLASVLTSPVAIGIYVILLLAFIIALIAMVMYDDHRNSEIVDIIDDADKKLTARERAKMEEEKRKKAEEDQASRFYMLTVTDRIYKYGPQPHFDTDISMEELCHKFRNFAASKLRLYYDITEIRRFIAGMAVSHILIMQGMSGTGKTSLAYAFGEFLDNTSVIVPIQPMWKERTDLLGYYNEFTRKFNETTLLQKMYEANYSDEIYVTVLDEMNIARVEYYFAEFLSLLELPNPDGRYIDVVSDKWENDPKLLREGQLKLPENMWFIGTANNDDSTFAISDKVYDRAMIMNLDKKTTVFEGEHTDGIKLSLTHFKNLVADAQRNYGVTNRNIVRLKALDAYMIENFHITFGNRIMKQINTYVPVFIACGGEELEALDDIICKKIMRKLETQNPVYVRNSVDGLCAKLDELFGEDGMPLCKEYLRRLERTI